MAVHTHYLVELCAGAGMLGTAVKLALDDRVRTVGYVERETGAAATLVARMADATLDQAPIWDDITTAADGEFAEYVQQCAPLIVCGGYPCTPWSVAGKQRGVHDPRHLWPYIDAFIGVTKPECVFFENVGAHLRLGFGAVRRDLERRGYRVACGLFSAAEVGANHRRERLFILGLADPDLDGARAQVGRPDRGESVAGTGEELPFFALGPNDPRWRDAYPQPAVCRPPDGVGRRVVESSLSITGNGVVTLAAAYAFVSLAATIIGGES